ncbi:MULTISPECIES: hypothetical protein [unclassified Microcoleus]
MRQKRTLTLKRKTLDADAPYASPLNAEQLITEARRKRLIKSKTFSDIC